MNTPASPEGEGTELREKAARIIDPSRWAVMDDYLAEVRRKPNVGYDPDNFKDKASLAKADAILALLSSPAASPDIGRNTEADIAEIIRDHVSADIHFDLCGIDSAAAHIAAALALPTIPSGMVLPTRAQLIAAIEENTLPGHQYTGSGFEDIVSGIPEAAEAILALLLSASPSPDGGDGLKLPDADWLRRKVGSDPDLDVEAGSLAPLPPPTRGGE